NRTYYQDDNWRAAPKIGLGILFHPKSEKFAFQTGVYYTTQGYSARNFSCSYYSYMGADQEILLNDDKSFWVHDVSYTSRLLQVPLMARFSWRVTDDIRIFTSVGGSIGFVLKDKGAVKASRLGFSEEEVPVDYSGYGNSFADSPWLYPYDLFNPSTVSGSDRKTTWGLAAQVGVEYHKMVVTAGYDLDFGKEFKGADFALRYQAFSLSVGYKFRLK
ncbi:PorT family protein, partial [Parabacteroides sp. OttesenSCG-928-G06]|nr:PorT family protein [Parabacteroides sp. OttesenSCG-928-G06]